MSSGSLEIVQYPENNVV